MARHRHPGPAHSWRRRLRRLLCPASWRNPQQAFANEQPLAPLKSANEQVNQNTQHLLRHAPCGCGACHRSCVHLPPPPPPCSGLRSDHMHRGGPSGSHTLPWTSRRNPSCHWSTSRASCRGGSAQRLHSHAVGPRLAGAGCRCAPLDAPGAFPKGLSLRHRGQVGLAASNGAHDAALGVIA